jgi:N utilization substance protein A
MIPNALQPAQIDEVFLYPRLGRAVVLVGEDQLSLAIGRRGQNVRLASKLVGWDIEIMTVDEMNESLIRAEGWFRAIPGSSDELIEAFITEGFMSYDDLTFVEPSEMAEFTGCEEDLAEQVIAFAEAAAERLENMKFEPPNEEELAGRKVASHLADEKPTEPETVVEDTANEAEAAEETAGEETSEEAAPSEAAVAAEAAPTPEANS